MRPRPDPSSTFSTISRAPGAMPDRAPSDRIHSRDDPGDMRAVSVVVVSRLAAFDEITK
jgi:hypothetical protein